MLVITGTFENERFIPDRPVSLPQKTKVTVTIEEGKPVGLTFKTDERRKMYAQFCGIWTEKDYAEFNEAVKDFDVIEADARA